MTKVIKKEWIVSGQSFNSKKAAIAHAVANQINHVERFETLAACDSDGKHIVVSFGEA